MLGTIFKRGPIWCWDPLKIVILELKRKILINKRYTWTNSWIGYKSSAHAPIVILLWTILLCPFLLISTLALIRMWYFEGGGAFHNSVVCYIPSWNIEWTFPNKGVGGAFPEILKYHSQIEGPWGLLGKVTLRVKCSITMSINNNCTRRGSTITTVLFPNSNSKTNRLALRRIWYFERGSFLVDYILSIRTIQRTVCWHHLVAQLVCCVRHTQNTTSSNPDAAYWSLDKLYCFSFVLSCASRCLRLVLMTVP